MSLVQALARGKVAFGVTLTIADPFVAEVMAAQAFDFLMIDTEHSPMSAYQLQTQLIALRTSRAAILVRVPEHDENALMQALDLGAEGVVVPHVETGAECAAAVRAALYPPRGARGVGPRRAARLTDRETYFRRANDETFIGVMIESGPAVDNIDDILAVPGLGGVIIGTEDLAASLGHLNDVRHHDVGKAIEQISQRCAAAGVPFGRYAPSADAADRLISSGARLITVGSDLLFLEQGMSDAGESMLHARQRHAAAASSDFSAKEGTA
jgi:2-keto-3-deoxy-L-rhamnonate aldolase RhmA